MTRVHRLETPKARAAVDKLVQRGLGMGARLRYFAGQPRRNNRRIP
jgi:hypothetical protein